MHDAAENRTIALPLRDHTILGVCEAIGEDFGFNPTWLRVPLAACVLFSIEYAIAAYFVLGLVVLASRLLFPNPKSEQQSVASPVANAPAEPGENQQQELPLAA